MDEMTAAEFAEWQAYHKLEPIDRTRTDYMIASLTSIFYNFAQSFGGSGKRTVSKPLDFIPWVEERQKEAKDQSLDAMKASVLAIAGVADTSNLPKRDIDRPPKSWLKKMKGKITGK